MKTATAKESEVLLKKAQAKLAALDQEAATQRTRASYINQRLTSSYASNPQGDQEKRDLEGERVQVRNALEVLAARQRTWQRIVELLRVISTQTPIVERAKPLYEVAGRKVEEHTAKARQVEADKARAESGYQTALADGRISEAALLKGQLPVYAEYLSGPLHASGYELLNEASRLKAEMEGAESLLRAARNELVNYDLSEIGG